MKKDINYIKKHPILTYIPTDHHRKKADIMRMTGLSEREVRERIAAAAKDVCIYISSHCVTGGYRRGKLLKELDEHEMRRDYTETFEAVAEFKSREKQQRRRMRSIIARQKAIEKESAKRGICL